MLQGYKENVKFYRRSKVSKSENRPYIKRVWLLRYERFVLGL
jgi:hypothetical protein